VSLPLMMGWRAPVAAASTEAAAGLSALIVLPLASALLTFGEDAIARLNRLRERGERVFETMAPLAEPRWGWSVSGIVVVFFALAFFGAKTLEVTPAIAHSAMQIPVAAVAIAAVLAAGAVASRDWRRAIGVLCAVGLADAVGAWGYARAGVALTGLTWLALLQLLGVAGVLVLLVANAARARPGEDTSAASARALTSKAGAVVAASASAIAILLPLSVGLRGEAIALAVAMLFAGLGAILFQPAVTIAVESLIPRRSTIAARYRVNPNP
jgi:hypothetical protein